VEGELAPALFEAETEKEYSTPASRPAMVHSVDVVEQVAFPGVAVTL
jgi:hypothetical protein